MIMKNTWTTQFPRKASNIKFANVASNLQHVNVGFYRQPRRNPVFFWRTHRSRLVPILGSPSILPCVRRAFLICSSMTRDCSSSCKVCSASISAKKRTRLVCYCSIWSTRVLRQKCVSTTGTTSPWSEQLSHWNWLSLVTNSYPVVRTTVQFLVLRVRISEATE